MIWEEVVIRTKTTGRGIVAYWALRNQRGELITRGLLWGLLSPSPSNLTTQEQKAHTWTDPGKMIVWAKKNNLTLKQ